MTDTEQKPKTGIPALDGIGHHQCLTKQEVADERRRRRAPPVTTYMGRTIPELGKALAALAVLAALFSFVLGPTWWIFGPAILGVLIGFFMQTMEPLRDETTGDLEPLTVSQLKTLTELAEKVPPVKAAVVTWLAEGKTLRYRDCAACERFAERYLDHLERKQLLDHLASPPEVETHQEHLAAPPIARAPSSDDIHA